MKTARKSTSTPRREGPIAVRPRAGSDPKRAPARCPGCGAVYGEGHWTWASAPRDAASHECPACRRVRERHAGGIVTLSGPFLLAHRDEILDIVRARETHEKAQHALERIIAIEPAGDDLVVTTTEPHLARAIVHALHGAFKGETELNEGQSPVRATWRR